MARAVDTPTTQEERRLMKNRQVQVTMIIVIMVLALVGYYSYLSGRARDEQVASEMGAIEKVLSRNLTNDYPPTPREVMRYYNEMTKCLYNEECDPEDVEALGIKIREICDAELNGINDLGTYLKQLQSQVEEHHTQSIRLTGTTVASSTNVDYYERDGYQFARLLCVYHFTEGKASATQRVIFLLRKDADKRWKIYGWDLEENVDLDGDGIPDGAVTAARGA